MALIKWEADEAISGDDSGKHHFFSALVTAVER